VNPMINNDLSATVISWILFLQVIFVSVAMIIVLVERKRRQRLLSKRIFRTKFLKIQPYVSRFFLRTPVASWFLALFLTVLEVINGIWSTGTPAIEAWGFKVDPTAAVFMTFILAAYHQLAAWQMSSMFLRQYREIEEIWRLDGLTHKLFIQEALTSLRNVAKEIAHRIDQGNPNGTNPLDKIRSHNGIYDTDDKSIKDRENDIIKLLMDLDGITNYFFALDKKPGDREKVIEELFLQIMKTTVKPLMEKTSGLVDSSDKPVRFPEHYAPIIMDKTLNCVKSSRSSAFIPGATSRFILEKFRKVYEGSDKPVNKARRVFLLTDEWKATTIDEINKIQSKSSEKKAPRPITTEAKIIFGESNPICHYAWSVDYHDSIGWQVKFMDIAEFDQLWDVSNLRALKYNDFLVAPCNVDSLSIVFSADMDQIENGLKHINLPIDMRRVQVFWDKGEAKDFYNKVWDKAFDPTKFLEKNNLYKGNNPTPYEKLLTYLKKRTST